MQRLTAYDVKNTKYQFLEKLKQEGFRMYGNNILSGKKGVSFSMGFFDNEYFMVRSNSGMNSAELDERSRLLRIADDFVV